MGLNRQHQLQLIKDILTDHQLDCRGTVAEYEQVGRVIQLMLAKEDLDADVRQLLTDIYDYSQKVPLSVQLMHISKRINRIYLTGSRTFHCLNGCLTVLRVHVARLALLFAPFHFLFFYAKRQTRRFQPAHTMPCVFASCRSAEHHT